LSGAFVDLCATVLAGFYPARVAVRLNPIEVVMKSRAICAGLLLRFFPRGWTYRVALRDITRISQKIISIILSSKQSGGTQRENVKTVDGRAFV